MHSKIAYNNVLPTLSKKLHLADTLNVAARRSIAKISVSSPAPSVIITYVAAVQVSFQSDGEALGAKTRTTPLDGEALGANTRTTQLDGEALGAVRQAVIPGRPRWTVRLWEPRPGQRTPWQTPPIRLWEPILVWPRIRLWEPILLWYPRPV